MRTALIVVVLCALAVLVAAQGQSTVDSCKPSGDPKPVCPPTGNSMGQSNYQRAPHREQAPQPAAASAQPATTPPDFEAPFETPPSTESAPGTSAPAIGAGPEVDTTIGERRNIAVDEKFVYVLQGDEVVKLDKSDLHVVARVKLP